MTMIYILLCDKNIATLFTTTTAKSVAIFCRVVIYIKTIERGIDGFGFNKVKRG